MERYRAMKQHTAQWLLIHLPFGLLARPGEWFIAVICALSGITIVTGVGTINSVNESLPRPIYYVWGVALLIGSFALACGLASITRLPNTNDYRVTRMACYRLGLRLLSRGAFLYAGCVLYVAAWSGIVAAGLALVFAAMLSVRLLTVGIIRMPLP